MARGRELNTHGAWLGLGVPLGLGGWLYSRWLYLTWLYYGCTGQVRQLEVRMRHEAAWLGLGFRLELGLGLGLGLGIGIGTGLGFA